MPEQGELSAGGGVVLILVAGQTALDELLVDPETRVGHVEVEVEQGTHFVTRFADLAHRVGMPPDHLAVDEEGGAYPVPVEGGENPRQALDRVYGVEHQRHLPPAGAHPVGKDLHVRRILRRREGLELRLSGGQKRPGPEAPGVADHDHVPERVRQGLFQVHPVGPGGDSLLAQRRGERAAGPPAGTSQLPAPALIAKVHEHGLLVAGEAVGPGLGDRDQAGLSALGVPALDHPAPGDHQAAVLAPQDVKRVEMRPGCAGLPALQVDQPDPVRQNGSHGTPVGRQHQVPRLVGQLRERRRRTGLRVLLTIHGCLQHPVFEALGENRERSAVGPQHPLDRTAAGKVQIRQGVALVRRGEILALEGIDEQVAAVLVEQDLIPRRGHPEAVEARIEIKRDLARKLANGQIARVQSPGEQLPRVQPVQESSLQVVQAAALAPSHVLDPPLADPAVVLGQEAPLAELPDREVVQRARLGVHEVIRGGRPGARRLREVDLDVPGDQGLLHCFQVDELQHPEGGGLRAYAQDIAAVGRDPQGARGTVFQTAVAGEGRQKRHGFQLPAGLLAAEHPVAVVDLHAGSTRHEHELFGEEGQLLEACLLHVRQEQGLVGPVAGALRAGLEQQPMVLGKVQPGEAHLGGERGGAQDSGDEHGDQAFQGVVRLSLW